MLNLETRPFSELVASANEIISTYADAGMVDESKLISTVARCNEVLGVRLNSSRSAILQSEDCSYTLPADFYKMECVMGVRTCEVLTGIPTSGLEQATMNPEKKTVFAHLNVENLWVPVHSENDYHTMQNTVTCEAWPSREDPLPPQCRRIVDFFPLTLAEGCYSHCTSYCPNHYWKAEYSVDMQEGIIKTHPSIKEIYICYLANLQDQTTGELLVPFHPKIWPYYEYSIMAKAFEIIMLNSDADVGQKLQYVRREANLAYTDAIDAVMSAKGKQWIKFNKEREAHFHHKWMRIFN